MIIVLTENQRKPIDEAFAFFSNACQELQTEMGLADSIMPMQYNLCLKPMLNHIDFEVEIELIYQLAEDDYRYSIPMGDYPISLDKLWDNAKRMFIEHLNKVGIRADYLLSISPEWLQANYHQR